MRHFKVTYQTTNGARSFETVRHINPPSREALELEAHKHAGEVVSHVRLEELVRIY